MTASGVMALIGSGELTASMVELHKHLLKRVGPAARAVFLDTPAGFQPNVDRIASRAADYFERHVGRRLSVASFKSRNVGTAESEQAGRLLRAADYVLLGPGSPTYTVRQLAGTPIPEILQQRLAQGASLAAASAAALTMGRLTLPVYEIYKVGEELHWHAGLNLLGALGLDLVVVPHWNNAEGGSHDTRRCFMGEARFRALEAMLPPGLAVLGLDEHTACLIDWQNQTVEVRGIGGIALRRQGQETVIGAGQRVPLHLLQGEGQQVMAASVAPVPSSAPVLPPAAGGSSDFWPRLHDIEARFEHALEKRQPQAAVSAILEMDRAIWSAQRDLESEEFISQGREILREALVLLGTRLQAACETSAADWAAQVVARMLRLREQLRRERQWHLADAIRAGLLEAGVAVEDTPSGARWHRVTDRVGAAVPQQSVPGETDAAEEMG